jgi:hypothetical protein
MESSLGSLGDDLRGLVHHAQGDRYEHGAGGDEGVNLVMVLIFELGFGLRR